MTRAAASTGYEPSAGEAKAALVGELRRDARIIAAILVVQWIILLADILFFGRHLRELGLVPRTATGLRGILFAPLLHENVAHLAANSIGFFMLGGLVILREEFDFWIVTLTGWVIAGAGTWLLGRPAVHIGYSGVIFAYLGYLLFTGWFERRLRSILLSLGAALVWGGLVFGVLPGQRGISWEGHLFGFVGGILAAWLLAQRRRRRAA